MEPACNAWHLCQKRKSRPAGKPASVGCRPPPAPGSPAVQRLHAMQRSAWAPGGVAPCRPKKSIKHHTLHDQLQVQQLAAHTPAAHSRHKRACTLEQQHCTPEDCRAAACGQQSWPTGSQHGSICMHWCQHPAPSSCWRPATQVRSIVMRVHIEQRQRAWGKHVIAPENVMY